MHDAAFDLQKKLRFDLKAAMQAKRRVEVAVLRSLIGAIDNAQAVPAGDLRAPYAARTFGESGTEVPRRALSRQDIHDLLAAEIEARSAAAAVYAGACHEDRAGELRHEVEIIRHYLDA